MTRAQLIARGYVKIRAIAEDAQLGIEAAFIRSKGSVYPSDGYEPWVPASKRDRYFKLFKAEAEKRARDRESAAQQKERIKKQKGIRTLAEWERNRQMYAECAATATHIGVKGAYLRRVRECDKYIARIKDAEVEAVVLKGEPKRGAASVTSDPTQWTRQGVWAEMVNLPVWAKKISVCRAPGDERIKFFVLPNGVVPRVFKIGSTSFMGAEIGGKKVAQVRLTPEQLDGLGV